MSNPALVGKVQTPHITPYRLLIDFVGSFVNDSFGCKQIRAVAASGVINVGLTVDPAYKRCTPWIALSERAVTQIGFYPVTIIMSGFFAYTDFGIISMFYLVS
jgi:hypothetical protein